MDNTVKYFTKPSILKLARKAGVKSLSEDAYPVIDTILAARIEQLVRDGLHIHQMRGARVLTCDDIQKGAELRGMFFADGNELKQSKATASSMK